MIDAKIVANIAFFFSSCGCEGLEDLSMQPHQASKHASEHVKLILGRDYPSPDSGIALTNLCAIF